MILLAWLVATILLGFAFRFWIYPYAKYKIRLWLLYFKIWRINRKNPKNKPLMKAFKNYLTKSTIDNH